MLFALRFLCAMAVTFTLSHTVVLAAPAKASAKAPAKATTQAPAQKLPWTLREHYTFSGGPLRLDYAKDNGEWRIKLFQEDSEQARMNPDLILKEVRFSIELADGRVLTNDMFGAAGETFLDRGPAVWEVAGEGTHYAIQFQPLEGLSVEHAVTMLKQWNFLLITLKVKNISENPISIQKIVTAEIPAGSLCGLSEQAEIGTCNMVFRGGHPVFSPEGLSSSLRIYDPVRQVIVNIALIPQGKAASGIFSTRESGQWHGRIESDFSPAKPLAPGASLEADPLWLSLGTAPALQDSQYSYLLYHFCKEGTTLDQPRAWVTVSDTAGLSRLKSEAGTAAALGITHALIPGNWESKPGSLEGGAPLYPRNINEAASALQAAGVTPGITLDALPAKSGGGHTAKSADGQLWNNPCVPEGKAAVKDRIRTLYSKGFGFFALEASAIPDDVLLAFGISRAEADTAAFSAAVEAVQGTKAAVLPAAASALPLNRDAWLAAASAAARIREGDIGIAPVGVLLNTDQTPDFETRLALQMWPGPFQFVDAPSGSAGRFVSALLARPPFRARPQDPCRTAPLIWLTRAGININPYVGEAIMQFSGASSWNVSDLECFNATGSLPVVWQDTEGKIARHDGVVIPAAAHATTLGLLNVLPEPMFCGISGEPMLGLYQAKKVQWDASKKILAGNLEGPFMKDAVAVFYLPNGMQPRSASLGGKSVRPQVSENWLLLPIDPAGNSFELHF
ncbi:MAG TPA: hypothetical protein PLQ42_07350 [Candidatus Hydrogenedentes bacterium]|nr:MAG: hypothetical protein BWY07_01166 [Candidatus Hydrogenedentes bacterium ADurb.Bin170]HNZ49084.1 hypothetical protein [Candidatus Hydrogenedentota bacterium]HOD95459.1 hypothetical protein [Candidatus Hydrogenedentota bacterium]HOM48544.1 hypothetical protein [Candidatus Hydrogenedentota bacterium]HOR50882.1 hypothetical protein [Candidatus Hydrogenedentota bacterium]